MIGRLGFNLTRNCSVQIVCRPMSGLLGKLFATADVDLEGRELTAFKVSIRHFLDSVSAQLTTVQSQVEVVLATVVRRSVCSLPSSLTARVQT